MNILAKYLKTCKGQLTSFAVDISNNGFIVTVVNEFEVNETTQRTQQVFGFLDTSDINETIEPLILELNTLMQNNKIANSFDGKG
jgi:hypothetical protein